MHPTKSRFIVVNGNDKSDFVLDGVSISHVESYVYLGTPISNNSLGEQVK